jgi:hypothetical protein
MVRPINCRLLSMSYVCVLHQGWLPSQYCHLVLWGLYKFPTPTFRKTQDVDDNYSESSWIFTLVLVQLQVIVVAIPLVSGPMVLSL